MSYDCITRNHLRYSDSIVNTRRPTGRHDARIAFRLDYCNALHVMCRRTTRCCVEKPILPRVAYHF